MYSMEVYLCYIIFILIPQNSLYQHCRELSANLCAFRIRVILDNYSHLMSVIGLIKAAEVINSKKLDSRKQLTDNFNE